LQRSAYALFEKSGTTAAAVTGPGAGEALCAVMPPSGGAPPPRKARHRRRRST